MRLRLGTSQIFLSTVITVIKYKKYNKKNHLIKSIKELKRDLEIPIIIVFVI